MLEPQRGAENKNAEADFKNSCSYKKKSVYFVLLFHTQLHVLTVTPSFLPFLPFLPSLPLHFFLPPSLPSFLYSLQF